MRRFLHPLLTLLLLTGSTIVTSPAAHAAGSGTSTLARLWIEPDDGYGFLDSAVASARHSVDASLYELRDSVMEQALVRDAARGVDVTVLLNAAYYGRSENSAAATLLSHGGVHVVWAPSGQIFHAKYIVVDHSRAYIGSGNLVASDYSNTRDAWVLDVTPSDVAAIETTFHADTHNAVSAGVASNGLVWSPGSLGALGALIRTAHRSLLIENEEMYSYPIEDDLVAAAERGVTVTVVMTRDAKYENDLSYLAHHGVRVRLLDSEQVYIHLKAICADCSGDQGRVFVGSINFSTSSLDYNRELGVITSTPSIVGRLSGVMANDALVGAPFS
jgi:phosphatidylserine/phosphatidylglycerophosphate/cardiolipin synthase-like enzyme